MPMEAQTRLRSTTGRERRIVVAVACALVAATIVVVVLALADFGSRPVAGCVSVTAPNSMGGAVLTQCGSGARQWCAEEATRPDALARQVEASCRRAGVAHAPRLPRGG